MHSTLERDLLSGQSYAEPIFETSDLVTKGQSWKSILDLFSWNSIELGSFGLLGSHAMYVHMQETKRISFIELIRIHLTPSGICHHIVFEIMIEYDLGIESENDILVPTLHVILDGVLGEPFDSRSAPPQCTLVVHTARTRDQYHGSRNYRVTHCAMNTSASLSLLRCIS